MKSFRRDRGNLITLRLQIWLDKSSGGETISPACRPPCLSTRERRIYEGQKMNYVFVLAFGIGIVAGLRSLTAPAVVAWGAHLGWLNLHGSPLAFMGSTTAVAIFSLLAIGELVVDKLPTTPKRTAPVGLIARIITAACAARVSPRRWGNHCRGSVARWNRRHCRCFSRLHHQETSGFAH